MAQLAREMQDIDKQRSWDETFYNLIAGRKWRDLAHFVQPRNIPAGCRHARAIDFPIRATDDLTVDDWKQLHDMGLLGPSEKILMGFIQKVGDIYEWEQNQDIAIAGVQGQYSPIWFWLFSLHPTPQNLTMVAALGFLYWDQLVTIEKGSPGVLGTINRFNMLKYIVRAYHQADSFTDDFRAFMANITPSLQVQEQFYLMGMLDGNVEAQEALASYVTTLTGISEDPVMEKIENLETGDSGENLDNLDVSDN